MNREIWKDVIGYEGLYKVSNHGRIKSLKFNKERILKNRISGSGYQYVTFCQNNKYKNFTIHRLIALHFISNPENKPQINHIDGNKLNNHISNLEWCTVKENIQHAFDNGLYENVRNKKYCSKQVQCIETGIVYESTMDVERKTGINNSNISKCCRGLRKSTGEYTWKYI